MTSSIFNLLLKQSSNCRISVDLLPSLESNEGKAEGRPSKVGLSRQFEIFKLRIPTKCSPSKSKLLTSLKKTLTETKFLKGTNLDPLNTIFDNFIEKD